MGERNVGGSRRPRPFSHNVVSAPISCREPRHNCFRLTRPPRPIARRASRKAVGAVSPGLVQFTTDPLFKDLWLRPDLAPRDRSLVTISSLIANGQMAQFTPHLNRAMDNGLTKDEAGEVIAQAAFYAGWPNAFSAAAACGRSLQEPRPLAQKARAAFSVRTHSI